MTDLPAEIERQRANEETDPEDAPMQDLTEELPDQLAEDLNVIDQVIGEREATRWEHVALQQRIVRVMKALVTGCQAQKQLQKERVANQLKEQFEGEVFEGKDASADTDTDADVDTESTT